MKRSSASAWVYLLLVFVGGAGFGFTADRFYTAKTVSADSRVAAPKSAAEYRQRYIEELHTRLHLEPTQVAKLTAILDDTDNRMKDLHERYRPEMTEIHKEQVKNVHAILTEKQSTEYDKMRAEHQKRREAENNRQQRSKGGM